MRNTPILPLLPQVLNPKTCPTKYNTATSKDPQRNGLSSGGSVIGGIHPPDPLLDFSVAFDTISHGILPGWLLRDLWGRDARWRDIVPSVVFLFPSKVDSSQWSGRKKDLLGTLSSVIHTRIFLLSTFLQSTWDCWERSFTERRLGIYVDIYLYTDIIKQMMP